MPVLNYQGDLKVTGDILIEDFEKKGEEELFFVWHCYTWAINWMSLLQAMHVKKSHGTWKS